MKFLAELDVSSNKLADLDWQLETLGRMQYLRTLDMRSNPCSQEVGYRRRVLEAVPSLQTLDGQAVGSVERSAAASAGKRGGAGSARSGAGSAGLSSTFGRGRPGLADSGLSVTRTGRPMFGAGGDTLTQRTLRQEAAGARRTAKRNARAAAITAIASNGKGRGWGSTLRRAKREGRASGAVQSLLSRRGAGLVEDAVSGGMLSRGCDAADTRRQGLGLLADLSATAAAREDAAASVFDRQQAKDLGRAAAASSRGGKVRGGASVASSSAASSSTAGGGRLVLAARSLGGAAGGSDAGSDAGGKSSANWGNIQRARQSVRGTSSLSDDTKAIAGAAQSGSASASAALMGLVGGALRTSRTGAHARASVGPQAVEAARLGHARGALGEWELARLKRLFKEADADGSGSLGPEEFRAALARAADWGFVPVDASDDGVSRAAAGAAFAALDRDGSGSVSYAEFVDALREQARPSGPLGGGERAPAPALVFRTLDKDEAESRARMHFKTASGLHSRLLRIPKDDPKRERITRQALDLSERGSRLLALARRLEGAADPPERPAPAPKARRDFRTAIQSVPEREARKTLRRGARDYRVAAPGEESDSDSDDDEHKQEGADMDEYRRMVRARKRHVVIRTTTDI